MVPPTPILIETATVPGTEADEVRNADKDRQKERLFSFIVIKTKVAQNVNRMSKRHANMPTDIQTDRQTDRQTERQIERQNDFSA